MPWLVFSRDFGVTPVWVVCAGFAAILHSTTQASAISTDQLFKQIRWIRIYNSSDYRRRRIFDYLFTLCFQRNQSEIKKPSNRLMKWSLIYTGGLDMSLFKRLARAYSKLCKTTNKNQLKLASRDSDTRSTGCIARTNKVISKHVQTAVTVAF